MRPTAAGVPQGLEIRMGNDESHGGGRPSRFDLTSQWQDGQAPSAAVGTISGDTPRRPRPPTSSRICSRATMSSRRGSSTRRPRSSRATATAAPPDSTALIFTGGATGQVGTPTQIELYNYPAIPQNNDTFTTALWRRHVDDRPATDAGTGRPLRARHRERPEAVPAGGPWSFTQACVHGQDSLQDAHSFAPRLVFLVRHHGQREDGAEGWLGPLLQAALQRREPDDQPVHLGDDHLPVARPERQPPLRSRRSERRSERAGLHQQQPPVSGISNPDEKPMGTDQFALTLERRAGAELRGAGSGVYIRRSTSSGS